MRAWRGSAGIAAAGPVFAASIVLFLPDGASAEIWRINDVDRSVSIHLRQHPSNKSKVLAYIPVDTSGLKGGPCDDNWCPIEFRGHQGYVFSKYLMPDEDAIKAEPESVGALPAQNAAAPAPELPKVLQVVTSDGPPTPVYAFPNENLPIAGHLAAETTSVERVGPCIQNWCNIRSGALTGWLQDTAIAKAQGTATPAKPSKEAAVPDSKEASALNSTETTATQADADLTAEPPVSPDEGNKFYSLAGLPEASLAMRGRPDDGASVVAFIPADAKDIEGLHKCTGKWCLVRRGTVSGWVERRHLADESVESSRLFQVSGWTAVEVFGHPGPDAEVVGRIPAYATGIVPIGGCDKTWCHVRYLGVAGWVSAPSLAPLTR